MTSYWRFFAAAVAVLLFTGPSAPAQPSGAAAGVSAAMVSLFGNHTAFTAQADIQVLDAQRKETLRMPAGFACLDGKIRIEIDLTQIKSKELTAKQISRLKQAGAAKIVTVIRPDKKESYVMYPGSPNYSIVPMTKAEADAAGKALRIEKTALSKETISGHPCLKNRVVVKDKQTVVIEAITWNATDLKDFPVQIETKDEGATRIMRFTKIQFARPDAKTFEPPAQYKVSK
jgi:hypothetical protein